MVNEKSIMILKTDVRFSEITCYVNGHKFYVEYRVQKDCQGAQKMWIMCWATMKKDSKDSMSAERHWIYREQSKQQKKNTTKDDKGIEEHGK